MEISILQCLALVALTSFALLGLVLLISNVRRGYLFAAPEVFAGEILKTLPDGVALLDHDGCIRFANEGLERCVGLDAQRLLGVSFDLFVKKPELALGTDLRGVECELARPFGECVPISLSTCTVRDRREHPLGLVVVIRDIAEVATLRRRLATSGRLAAVGQLAAGIAHEINNPLAFVRANLSVLRDHWQTLTKALDERAETDSIAEIVSDGEEIIDESLEGVDRAVSIVRDVREFSHAGGGQREWADLNQLLDRVTRVATPGLGPAIRIDRQYGEIPMVLSSPQQLKQVFLNLIVNAIQAVGEAGTIRLCTETKDDAVLVRVEDDGCGIPDDDIERIFDPFFTTKAVGQGTGLGLSISYEIIRNHGGEISVEPKADGGTCICVRLPIGGEEDEQDLGARASEPGALTPGANAG